MEVLFYLQAADGESPGVVGQRGDGDREGRVGDVLIVEFNGNFIITWRK